jgi:hypothetical protein
MSSVRGMQLVDVELGTYDVRGMQVPHNASTSALNSPVPPR